MANLARLEAYSKELSIAIQNLATYCQNNTADEKRVSLVSPEAPQDAHRARETALAILAKLQVMLVEPTDFLQQMASQTRVLACIQWLGEFQVPACIPLDGTALIKDIADLIGVPETQLYHIIEITTAVGFLHEPQQGYIAHSPLSTAFVTKSCYLDAAMFLAGTAAPAALKMAAAAKHRSECPQRLYDGCTESCSSSSVGTQLPRLQRQWDAYLRYGASHLCDTATDILTYLEPFRTRTASVVEVGARSTERAIAFANQNPNLHVTVQLNPFCATPVTKNASHPRIHIQHRVPGTPQTIQDAAVYIINFPLLAPGAPSISLAAQINAELSAHINTLRINRFAAMVLTTPCLSDTTGGEILTRIRDLSLLQLASEHEVEMSEVMNMIDGVSDGEGRLVLVNKVRSAGNSGAIALEIRYRAYAEG